MDGEPAYIASKQIPRRDAPSPARNDSMQSQEYSKPVKTVRGRRSAWDLSGNVVLPQVRAHLLSEQFSPELATSTSCADDEASTSISAIDTTANSDRQQDGASSLLPYDDAEFEQLRHERERQHYWRTRTEDSGMFTLEANLWQYVALMLEHHQIHGLSHTASPCAFTYLSLHYPCASLLFVIVA